jgi:cytochrome c oxidase subunit 2
LVIFYSVFGVMFYSIWKHRKSVGHKSANFHESTAVEIAWTVGAFLIVIGMAACQQPWLPKRRQRGPDHQGHWHTGGNGRYDYIKAGEGLAAVLSTLDNSHRAMSDAGGPKGW